MDPYWKQILEFMQPRERYTVARLCRLTQWDRTRVYQALNTAYVERKLERAKTKTTRRDAWEYWRVA
jgi:hypothetical protein